MSLNYSPFNNRFPKNNGFYKYPNRHFFKPTIPTIPSSSDKSKENCSKENPKDVKDNNDMFFELFGIKLHYDDILLISLIFFLYNEGVEDKELFISLILLLLS